MNTYAYVGNNPLSNFDDLGLTQADIDCLLAYAKKTETDLKFPKSPPVVKDMGESTDAAGNPIITVGEYNPWTGKMYLSDIYLQPLSVDQKIDLYDTIVHEALHKTYGLSSGFGQAHVAVYIEAGERAAEQAAAITEGETNCDCH